MKIHKTKLKGLLRIELDIFEDFRGDGIDVKFIQDDISVSSRGVLRGIHGDDKTWKLISCLWGRFYFVVVDCDPSSEDFGRWESFVLSDRNRQQILVPPNYGNAHLVLSDTAIFHYKQSTYYDPASQFSYRWDDPRFNIWWPVKNPLLSQRDEAARYPGP